MEKISARRPVWRAALVSLPLFAAGSVMGVFYFPAAAALFTLKTSPGKYDFPLLAALAALVASVTAPPAALAFFAAAVSAAASSWRSSEPRTYFGKLSAGFFGALALFLAGAWAFRLLDGAEIFRTMNKIFFLSLAVSSDLPAEALPSELAEKAFTLVPAMAMIMLCAGYFLNLVFRGLLTGRRCSFGRAAKAVPVSVYLLALAIAMAAVKGHFAASYLSANLLTVSLFMFFVSGCGIIWSAVMRLGAGPFLAAVATASFVFMWPAAAAVGVLGRWIWKRGQD